jgi:peptidoglycan/xylan/chitin deacetylase (PgdA/CDA1 family)
MVGITTVAGAVVFDSAASDMTVAVRALGRPGGFVIGHLLRLSNRPLAVALMYHRVAEHGGDPQRELVPAHSARLFERQLKHLRHTYRLVPASRLLDEAARRRRGQRIPVAVTFDDDLACHRDVAMPILTRLGVPAAFFLSGASLDRPFSFWWERLERALDRGTSDIHEAAGWIEGLGAERRDIVADRLLDVAGPDPDDAGMRADDVRALTDAGFEIGFHTLRHYRLTGLDDDALRRAMTEGREALAELTGKPAAAIAYPHGKADARVAAAARAAGFRLGFRSLPGAIDAREDPLLLRRVEPSFGSIGEFAVQLGVALLRSRRAGARA